MVSPITTTSMTALAPSSEKDTRITQIVATALGFRSPTSDSSFSLRQAAALTGQIPAPSSLLEAVKSALNALKSHDTDLELLLLLLNPSASVTIAPSLFEKLDPRTQRLLAKIAAEFRKPVNSLTTQDLCSKRPSHLPFISCLLTKYIDLSSLPYDLQTPLENPDSIVTVLFNSMKDRLRNFDQFLSLIDKTLEDFPPGKWLLELKLTPQEKILLYRRLLTHPKQSEAFKSFLLGSDNGKRLLLELVHPEIANGLTKKLNKELDLWVLEKLHEMTTLDRPIDFEAFVLHLLSIPEDREKALKFLAEWLYSTENSSLFYLKKGFGLSETERVSLYGTQGRYYPHIINIEKAKTLPPEAKAIYYLDFAYRHPTGFLSALQRQKTPPSDLAIICIRKILNNPETTLYLDHFTYLAPLAKKHRFEALLVKKQAAELASQVGRPTGFGSVILRLEELHSYAKSTTPPTTEVLQTQLLQSFTGAGHVRRNVFQAYLFCIVAQIPLEKRSMLRDLIPPRVIERLEIVFAKVKNFNHRKQCLELLETSSAELWDPELTDRELDLFITKIIPNLAKTKDHKVFETLNTRLKSLVKYDSFTTLIQLMTVNGQPKIALCRFLLLLLPNTVDNKYARDLFERLKVLIPLVPQINGYNNTLRNDDDPFTMDMLRLFAKSYLFGSKFPLLRAVLEDNANVKEAIRLMSFLSNFDYAWKDITKSSHLDARQLDAESTLEHLRIWRKLVWEFEYGLSSDTDPEFFEKLAFYFDTPRMLGMLEAYQAGRDPTVRKTFVKFITGVIDGTFLDQRYDECSSTHLRELASLDGGTVLSAWRTPLIRSLGSHLVVTDTDHYEDLYLMGTEVPKSCQTVFGNTMFNCALMGYLYSGQLKVLAVKSAETGKIVTRAVCRLLFDSQTKAPCLFVEQPYGVTSSTNVQAILDLALEKARQLGGIPVYTKSYAARSKPADPSVTIESKGSPFPFNYVDADHIGVSSGNFKLSRLQLLL